MVLTRPCYCLEKPQVTGTGGGEQPGEAPTPTPAPTGAPDPTPAADTTPAPAAGVGGLVGAIKNAVTGGGSPSGGDTAAVPVTSTTDEAPPADAAPGVLGNLTSSISSAAHTVTDAATSTISSAAHSVTGAASGIMGHKKDAGDAAVPAAGDGAAAEKEGETAVCFFVVLHACGIATNGVLWPTSVSAIDSRRLVYLRIANNNIISVWLTKVGLSKSAREVHQPNAKRFYACFRFLSFLSMFV